MKGCPSSLTRHIGNLHVLCADLRAAFYHELKIDFTVKESFIAWDFAKNDTYWTQTELQPNPKLRHLLYSLPKALSFYISQIYIPKDLKITDLDWNNHVFGLAAIICDFQS